MEIRRYRSSDARGTAQLFYNTVHTVNGADYAPEQLNAWAPADTDIEKWNDSFKGHFAIVAIMNGELAGFGDIDEATGYLDRLYVKAGYTGRGIGTALCDRLERRAAGDVSAHASITARPFFEKRGYAVIREQQVERRGILLKNYAMLKTKQSAD